MLEAWLAARSSTSARPSPARPTSRTSGGSTATHCASAACSCPATPPATTSTRPPWSRAWTPSSSASTTSGAAWERLVAETRDWSGDVLISHEHFSDSPADAAARATGRPGRGRRRGARGPHRAGPGAGAPLGLAAAGQAGGPPDLRRVPGDRAPRAGRPEVLALPGRARHPRPLDGGLRPCPRAPSSYLPRAHRATSCGCARALSSESTSATSTPRRGAPTSPSASSKPSCCDGSTRTSPASDAPST